MPAAQRDVEWFEDQKYSRPDQRIEIFRPKQSQSEHGHAREKNSDHECASRREAWTGGQSLRQAKGENEFGRLKNSGHHSRKGNRAQREVLEAAEFLTAEVFPVARPVVDHFEEPPGGRRGEKQPNE